GFVPGNGKAPKHRTPVVFMVTNSCPINENRVWCGQSGKPGTNRVNDHGYEAHFDLQNNKGQVLNGLGWDNAEVTLPAACAVAEQKCHRNSQGVRVYNGKKCASTTRYNDGHRGSCGCGPSNSDTPFDWNLSKYVTAPNQMYYDNGGYSSWCGRNCGKCVKLTPT
ncbi:endoglucanase-like, partial [Aplysia californica]|uniref:Endoglucanase-like n=1 Tax=Aplysia californica TaxID=6500 RepID=A0ABM1AFC1_APLCA